MSVLPVIDEAEVVVVGGGPAGSACAARLAELGRDVLVVDQHEFPRDKPCGDGLPASSIAHLESLGLDELVASAQPIDGARLSFDFRRSAVRRFDRDGNGSRPTACCVPRMALDAALADAAVARGARMTVARANRPVLDGERVRGVEVKAGGRDGMVAARYVVAADGVTSRMRRELGLTPAERKPAVYAVRQYFNTERELDPYWDVYVPVEYEGFGLAGYGWVFPIGERLANVGIGYFGSPAVRDRVRIRRLLTWFTENLVQRVSNRTGELEPIDRPLGSPVGIGFSAGHCQRGDVFFVGDAARTTDPMTGEGIANAMTGGAEIAELVNRRAAGRGFVPDVGRHLARRFPQVAQDVSMLARLTVLGVNGETTAELGGKQEDAGDALRRVIVTSGQFDPSWGRTAVGRLVRGLDAEAAAALEQVGLAARDLATTTFPFMSEVLAREFVSAPGPVPSAAVVLAARACGASATSSVRALATTAAYSTTLQRSLAEVVDRPRTQAAEAQNAAILLYSDFAMSRASSVLDELPPRGVGELARALIAGCKGTLQSHNDRFDVNLPEDRQRAVAEQGHGTIGATTVALAAQLAGAPRPIVEALRVYGAELALAFLHAMEIHELVRGGEMTGHRPGFHAALGFYSLPLLHAARHDEVRRMLVRGADEDDMPRLVDAVRRAGGFERALDECHARVARARAAVDGVDVERPALLISLAEFAERWAQEGVPAPAAASADRTAA